MKRGVSAFFKYARLRHEAYHNKMAGLPRGRQSTDPTINGGTKFTNVFRELDKTTVWFANNVRNPLHDKPEVLLATVLFRLLNRIEVGEAIFCQAIMPLGRFKLRGNRVLTAWDAFLASGDVGILKQSIKIAIPDGPYATGAYIISSPPGYTKLDGILEIVRRFTVTGHSAPTHGEFPRALYWRDIAGRCLDNQSYSLETMWGWLKQFDYFGPFHSYEIVSDLRHTALLSSAPDIMMWANPGPGARRGLNWVHGRAVKGSGGADRTDMSASRDQMMEEMRELLEFSQDGQLWPNEITSPPKEVKKWPRWEMRDVEHTLCEFDKWNRVRAGGHTRGVYR